MQIYKYTNTNTQIQIHNTNTRLHDLPWLTGMMISTEELWLMPTKKLVQSIAGDENEGLLPSETAPSESLQTQC